MFVVAFSEIALSDNAIRCALILLPRHSAKTAHAVAAQDGVNVIVRQQFVIVRFDLRRIAMEDSLLCRQLQEFLAEVVPAFSPVFVSAGASAKGGNPKASRKA